MKNRFKAGVLCICILLTGCGSATSELSDDSGRISSVPSAEIMTSLNGPAASATYSGEDTVSGNGALSEDAAESSELIENDTEEAADITESGREGQSEAYYDYGELITDAKECIEGNGGEDPDNAYDFSYVIYGYGPNRSDKEALGYLIVDLDGDGTEELIFGENGSGSWKGVIYDLYTINDGKALHLFSGGERARYYLCENGMIAHEGSSSAATSLYAYYSFEGTELHLEEAVLYNGLESPEHPWFYSVWTDDYYDLENAEPIGEEQAQAVMEQYVYERLTFIPFVGE